MERGAISLIFMLTFEGIVILSGELNNSFCDVVWEVSLKNLVLVEQATALADGFTLLLLWYLHDDAFPSKSDEHYVAQAKALVAGTGGLGCMHCKPVCIPHTAIRQLLHKMKQIDSRFEVGP
jgi:hypothetical protein